MAETTRITRFRGGLWLIRMIGGIVPRRLHAHSHPVEAKDMRFRSPLIYRHIGIDRRYRFDVARLEFAPSRESLSY